MQGIKTLKQQSSLKYQRTGYGMSASHGKGMSASEGKGKSPSQGKGKTAGEGSASEGEGSAS